MSKHQMRVGDLIPSIENTLRRRDANGTLQLVDLTGKTVTADGRLLEASSNLFSGRSCTINADPTTGKATIAWVSGDTDTVGILEVEYIVTDGSGNSERCPVRQQIHIYGALS